MIIKQLVLTFQRYESTDLKKKVQKRIWFYVKFINRKSPYYNKKQKKKKKKNYFRFKSKNRIQESLY